MKFSIFKTKRTVQVVLVYKSTSSTTPISTGLLIFRGKKAKFRGIFRGKFAEKSADFAGFSRGKSQNSPENRSISRGFSGKKSNFEGF